MCCQNEFINQLRERGLRLTPQREVVLDVLHHLEGHVTVEEIYQEVQQVSPSVDISTVYRTLEVLQEFHLVAVVDIGDGQRRYELLTVAGPHHHLLCRHCGQMVTIEPDLFDPLVRRLEEGWGFTAELEHVIIPGICQACRDVAGVALPEVQAIVAEKV